MVGLQKARPANTLAEPHSSGGGILQRDHCSSSPARHANPEGDEAVLARPRPVHVDVVQNFHALQPGQEAGASVMGTSIMQCGAVPSRANDKYVIRDFRKDVLRELKKLKICWPALNYATPTGCLEIRACPPSVTPKSIGR